MIFIKAMEAKNHKTVYKCDRCKTIIDTYTDNRYKITAQSTNTRCKTIKSYDLCDKCFKSMVRGIERKNNYA